MDEESLSEFFDLLSMEECWLHERIDRLGATAEFHLEQIPTELSTEEMMHVSIYAHHFELYEECNDLITTIQEELRYGAKIY